MEQILEDFPFLEKADIFEALAFAALTMDDQYMPLQQVRA